MSEFIRVYLCGGLISMVVVLLLAALNKESAFRGLKVAAIVSVIWPVTWSICIYLLIKRSGKA